jgi:hypothetical protein
MASDDMTSPPDGGPGARQRLPTTERQAPHRAWQAPDHAVADNAGRQIARGRRHKRWKASVGKGPRRRANDAGTGGRRELILVDGSDAAVPSSLPYVEDRVPMCTPWRSPFAPPPQPLYLLVFELVSGRIVRALPADSLLWG